MRDLRLLAGFLALVGCSVESSPAQPSSPSTAEAERDVRVAVPSPEPDRVDFVTPEAVIPPGTDLMLCAHLRWEGEDLAFDEQQTFQGAFGHHAVLMVPDTPLPTGTLEDCTDAAAAARFHNFSMGEPLPAGYGVRLAKGQTLALQFHYVNTSALPLRVRDVIRLHKIPMESVTRWTEVFTAQTTAIHLPPKAETTVEFDCTFPSEGEILLAAGHMHESGKAMEVWLGTSADDLEPVYVVDRWTPAYRDAPPVTRFTDAPLRVPEGALLRTRCTFQNYDDLPIGYPQEMCLAFGYLADATETPHCVVADE